MSNPNLYKCGGLLPTNGPEWKRLRTAAQPPLSKKNLEKHIPAIDQASLNFVEMIGTQERVGDILEELKKYFLEITGIVVLGRSLEAIQSQLHPNSIAASLIKAAMETNSHILETDNGLRLWRYFDTSEYKKIKESQVGSGALWNFHRAKSPLSCWRCTNQYVILTREF